MSSCIIKNTKNKSQMIRSEYDTKYNQTFATLNNIPIPQNTNPYMDHYNNFRTLSSRVPQRHLGTTPTFTPPQPLSQNNNKPAIYHKFTNII